MQLNADIERVLQCGRALRQRSEDPQSLLEPGAGLRKRRARGRPEAGLTEIRYRLLPQVAPDGVMGEALDLLAKAVAVEHLDGLDRPRMQYSPPLLQESPVRHLVREGVLECVFEVGEQLCLVQKFSSLQPIQP